MFREKPMNEEIKVPFLLCIPLEKRGNIIEALGEYQKKHHGLNLDVDLRTQFPELPLPQIPVRPDMTEEELGKFISQPPSHQACPPELPGSGGREKVD